MGRSTADGHVFWVGEPGFARRYRQALDDMFGELWLQPAGYASQRGGRGLGVLAFKNVRVQDSAALLGIFGGGRGGRRLGLSLKPQQG